MLSGCVPFVCVSFIQLGKALLPEWSQQLMCGAGNELSIMAGVILNEELCYLASARNTLTRANIDKILLHFLRKVLFYELYRSYMKSVKINLL